MFDLLNTKARLFKAICLSVAACFLLTGAMPSQAFAQHLGAPPAPSMVPLSPAYTPTLVRGIRVYPDNPFTFDFIVDSGDTGLTGDALTKESEKLIRYFLASLTIPENNLWVNLSPHEKDRIIPDTLGATEMGHDMLAQDYLLKQITASLTNPDSDLGKEFWAKVYKKSYEEFGTTNIPVDTFNKVWIMPDKAEVYENGDKAFVVESRLKVMLEEDYVALQAKQQVDSREHIVSSEKPLLNTNDQILTTRNTSTPTSTFSSQIVREVFIPVLEKEVNEGKNFAQLRQIYDVIILGYWYKTKLKDSILNQVYANQQKVKGIDFSDKAQTQAIYEQYLDTFKKGVCNMMKVEYDPYVKKVVPRKYFAGGVTTADVGKVFKSGQDPSACSTLVRREKESYVFTSGFLNSSSSDPSRIQDQNLNAGNTPISSAVENLRASIREEPVFEHRQILETFLQLLEKSPPEFSKMLSLISKRKILFSDFSGKIEVLTHAEGSNKVVYKAIVHLQDQEKLTIAIAVKKEKEEENIQVGEINDLQWLSTVRNREFGLTPVFGALSKTADGRLVYFEEFIDGDTVSKMADNGRLPIDLSQKVLETFFTIGILLGNIFPRDIHQQNFILDPNGAVKMVDIGNRRFVAVNSINKNQKMSILEFIFNIFLHYGQGDSRRVVIPSLLTSLERVEKVFLEKENTSLRKNKSVVQGRNEMYQVVLAAKQYLGSMTSQDEAFFIKHLMNNPYFHGYCVRRHINDVGERTSLIHEILSGMQTEFAQIPDNAESLRVYQKTLTQGTPESTFSASSSSSVSVYLSGYKEEVNFQEQDLSDIPEEEQREFYRSASEFDLLQIERFSKQTILALCRKWFDDPNITEATLSRFVKIHPASNVPLGQVRQAQNDLYDFKINIESLKMDLRDNMGLDHPPVLIVRLDSGDYLVDGLTRTYVALQKGRISLPAVVVELKEEDSRAAQKNAEQDLAKAQPVMNLSQYKIFSYEVDHDLPEYYARAYPWTRFSRELAEDAMEKIQQFDNNAAELYLEEKAKVLQALMGSGDKKRVIESLSALDASRTGRVIEISQEALQVITRTLTASRDRQSYAAQLEYINRHWGSASSHGNRSSIFYKIASLYYDYGQYEKAIDAAETAIRVGAEPGHDNFPTRLLIQAQDLIRSAKSYIQSEKDISLQIGDLVIKAKGTASPLGIYGLSSSAIAKPTIDEFRQVLEEIKKKGFLNRSEEFLSRLQDLDPRDAQKHWSEEGAENLGSDLYAFAREIRQALDSNPAGRFLYNTLNVGGPFAEKLDVINPLSGVSMTLRSPDKDFLSENFDTLQVSLEKVRDVFKALEENEYTLADVKFWNEENGFYLDIFHQGSDLLQGQAGVGNSPLLAKKIESLKQWEPAWIFGSGRSEYNLVAEQQELDDNAWELWLEDSQTGKRARACAFTLFGLPNGKVLFYDFILTEGDLVWEDKQKTPDDEFSKMQKLLEAISPSADARVEHLKDLSLMDQLYYWLKKRGIIEQEDILEKSIEVQKTREFDRKIYLDEELNAFSFTDGDIRYLVPAAGADEHTIKALMGDKDKIISANELARFFAFGSLEGGEGFDVRLTFQQMLDFEDERYPGYYQEYYIDGLSALYMYYFDNSKEARQVDLLGEIGSGRFSPGSPAYEWTRIQKEYFARYAKSRIEDTRPSDGGQNILSLLDGQLLFTPLFVTEIRLSDSAPGEGRDPFKDAREITEPAAVIIADSNTSTANKRFYSQIKEKLDGQIIVDPDGSQNYKVFVQTDLKKVNQNDPIVDVEVHLIDEQGKKSVSPVFAFQILSPGQIRQFESFLLGVSFTEQDRAALKDVTIEDLDQIFEEMLDKIDNGIPLSYGDLSGGIVERQFFRYLASALETGNGVIEGDYAQYQIIDDQLWGQPFFYDQASGFYKKQRDDGPGYDFIIASESQRVMAEVFKEPQDRIITFQQLASLLVFKDLYFAERSGMAIQLSWLIDQGFPGSMENPEYLEELAPMPMEEATGVGVIKELIKYRSWAQEIGMTRNDNGEFAPQRMNEEDLTQMIWELPSPRLRFTIQASSSTLFSGNAQSVDQLGGIDFNAKNMNVKIREKEGKGSLGSLSSSGLLGSESSISSTSSINSIDFAIPDSIQGLTPVILNVVPVADFMGLLGLSTEEQKAVEAQLSQSDSSSEDEKPSQDTDISEIAFYSQKKY